MKKLLGLSIIACLALSSSACISTGGESVYTVEPIEKKDGTLICCKVAINNTKDYDTLSMNFNISKDGTLSFTLDEDGVNSSTPAAIAAESNSKMAETISNLVELLPLTKGQ